MRNWLREQLAEFGKEWREHPFLMPYAVLAMLLALAFVCYLYFGVYILCYACQPIMRS